MRKLSMNNFDDFMIGPQVDELEEPIDWSEVYED